MKHILRTLALPTALAATLVLSACGTGDMAGMSGTKTKASAGSSAPAPSGTPASEAKNPADVLFATMMIPHHAQAIAMADIALKRATDPKVVALAPKVKAAQGPENERMTGWLTGWGEAVPDASGGSDMSDMHSMGGQTGGMMSAQEMTDLRKAAGPAFDRMWLQMMVRHHQGAVEMAKTELAKGTNPESKQLARSIIDAQSAEVAEINSILKGL
jgi:uncharacterized protein (DUF305 family)